MEVSHQLSVGKLDVYLTLARKEDEDGLGAASRKELPYYEMWIVRHCPGQVPNTKD
jgi:hypothetical protein